MDSNDRLEICRQMTADKFRIGLPLASVRAVEEVLRTDWNIMPPPHPSVWEEELERRAGPELYASYVDVFGAKASAFDYTHKLSQDTFDRFYDVIADDRISGFVHSKKRVFILDAAALLLHLVPRLEIKGPILDVGSHIGYHALILGQETGREVHGIDVCEAAIQAARRKTRPGLNVRFHTKMVDWVKLKGRFEFVYALDLETEQPFPKTVAAISNALKPNGVALLGGMWWVNQLNQLQHVLTSNNLGVACVDLIGGWHGDDRGFSGSLTLLLIKGSDALLPKDVIDEANTVWPSFMRYCQNPGVLATEKTQAFFRAKCIDGHPDVATLLI